MNDARQTRPATRRPARLALRLRLLVLLACAFCAVVWAAPAAASATTIFVNSTADPGAGGCDATECTLREALADAGDAPATRIEFQTVGTANIVLASPLPPMPPLTTIAGLTADGAVAGSPTVNLVGGPSMQQGLLLGDASLVEGVAITGFAGGVGVRIAGASSTVRDCTIGASLATGTVTTNQTGVRVEGTGSLVKDNKIAGNSGKGVVVASSADTHNEIRHNSIANNGDPATTGLGIDLGDNDLTPNDDGDADTGPNGLQNFPYIDEAKLMAGELIIEGRLASTAGGDFQLEFFASAGCDASGYGEGEVPLGVLDTTTATDGQAVFEAHLPLPPAGMKEITATATDAYGATSEFSACLVASEYQPPPSGGGGGSSGGGASSQGTAGAQAVPPPVAGESVNLEPVSGSVLVRLPGTTQWVPLEALSSIPVGAVVDTRKGRVRLTVAHGDTTESAEFWKGRFTIGQQQGTATPLTTLKLFDSAKSCAKSARAFAGATTAKKKKKKRKKKGELWGDGKGDFRTQGDNGSATVRGTKWRTVNRCDGTLFAVKRGVVRVRDFNRKKTITLRAGQQYLAKAP